MGIGLINCICSHTILTFRIRSIRSPAKVGLVIIKLLTTSPVVSWRGDESQPLPPPTHPPTHPSTMAHLSFFAQPPLSEDLSLSVVSCPSSSATLFTLMVDWCLFDFLYKLECCFFCLFRLCQENEEFVFGLGGRECGAFLSSLDRDPHPTCPRCRDKICTRDRTCAFCVHWSPAQWELCSDRILTFGIRSLLSPAKVGIGGDGRPPPPPPQHNSSTVILCSTTVE